MRFRKGKNKEKEAGPQPYEPNEIVATSVVQSDLLTLVSESTHYFRVKTSVSGLYWTTLWLIVILQIDVYSKACKYKLVNSILD